MAKVPRPVRSGARRIGSWLKNATVRYVGGVFILLIFGASGIGLSHSYFESNSFQYALIAGISEALIVSALLAAIVDPYLKRRMQSESAWDGMFGFLNNKAPIELKEALRELAESKVFLTQTVWKLTFDWCDRAAGIIMLTIEVQSTCQNIGRAPHKLEGEGWILASTTGYESRYLRYAVSCPGEIRAVDATGETLAKHTIVKDDGSVSVDEAGICGNQSIPAGKPFDTVKKARMYRHMNGYVPLHHGKFGVKFRVILAGDALDGIDVRIAHPTRIRSKPYEGRRVASKQPRNETFKFDRVMPGQVTLVSWKAAEHGVS